MNSINNFLTCKYNGCKKYFASPVKLPCEKSVCKEHIEKLKIENLTKFKCQFCQSEHDIPSDGFKLNQDIINVLEMNLHLTPSQRKLNDSINQLSGIVKNMKDLSKDTFIHDYLSGIKREIKKHRDHLKNQINDITNEFLKEVEKFEHECSKDKEKTNMNESLSDIKKEVKRLDIDLINYKKEIRNPNLDDEKCDKLTKNIELEVFQNDQSANKVRDQLMNNKSITFEKKPFKFEPSLFGSINLKVAQIETKKENAVISSLIKLNTVKIY